MKMDVSNIIREIKQGKLSHVAINNDGTLRLEFDINFGMEYEDNGKGKFVADNLDIDIKNVYIKDTLENEKFGIYQTYRGRVAIGFSSIYEEGVSNHGKNILSVTIPRRKPLELTLEDIEKKYGREVKIINNKS